MVSDVETASHVYIAFYSFGQLVGDNMVYVSLKLVEPMDIVCQFDAK